MKNKLGISAVIIIIVAGVWYAIDQSRQVNIPDNNINQESAEVQSPAETVFSYEGREGVDAMTLLKEKYAVETEEFGEGLGEFVTKIEGQGYLANEFWGFFVNGETANVGASNYITIDGDIIEWKIEKIGDY